MVEIIEEFTFMKKIIVIFTLMMTFLLSSCANSTKNNFSDLDISFGGVAGDDSLKTYMSNLVKVRGLVAVTGISTHKGEIVEQSSEGKKRRSKPDTFSGNEGWHIGSVSKSFTALLAGIYVEKGLISWDYTIAEAFPELATQMHGQHRGVTVRNLLTNSSGLISNAFELGSVDDFFNDTRPLPEQRYDAVKKAVNRQPEMAIGQYAYNNIGFLTVAVMLEKITNKSWETLITEEIFQPLGITSGGFGPPSQVWGHATDGVQWEELSVNDKYSDNPAFIRPAGGIHISNRDLAIYLQEHIMGNKGFGKLGSADMYRTLHKGETIMDPDEPLQKYAMGWIQKGNSLIHDGIVPGFSALVFIDLDKEVSIYSGTNIGEYDDAQMALLDIMNGMYKRILKKYYPNETTQQ